MNTNPDNEKRLVLKRVNGEGDADSARVSAALGVEIAAQFGPPEAELFSVLAYAEDGALAGGFSGLIHWRWLYVRHFWVDAVWRGKGVGRRLMAQAETDARARNCVGLYLDTFDPGAVRFYERCGFERFGAIADFPPGHARTFLRKRL